MKFRKIANKTKRTLTIFPFVPFSLFLLLGAAILIQWSHRTKASIAPESLKAGLAKVVITPEKPVWLAGYAARNKPSEGKLQDLYAKALAVEDPSGYRAVIVTSDLLGFPRALADRIAARVQKQYKLSRSQLFFNSSHTHTGPVLRDSLIGAYDLNTEQAAAIVEYAKQLEDKVVALIGSAIRDLSPAKLSFGSSKAQFAMNRRQLSNGRMIIGVNPDGVVDRDVPVLRVESSQGKLRGIVFGYACHNTTLTGEFYQFSGDYAGFAQEAIEKANPGVMSLFVTGCGADINPYPRSKLELASQHGEELAGAVDQVLRGSMSPVSGRLRTAFDHVMLPFAPPPTKEEFQSRLSDSNAFRRRHAERMLARLERDGKLISEYPCALQVIRIGDDWTLIGLAGEVVTDYSLRLKRELSGRVWVAGYSNDVFAYVPSARMFKEGGYEVVDSMIFYDQPGPFAPEIEEKIIGKVHELVRRVSSSK
ncbi:MAG: neutral/alkaline non-lysosomal ceramidase N-terminal domain-containing protein [Acidobacteria bacterium]|nr:neutral/alkaline non-lysosomal ceramidase N-terminal domain-containing protein [Acidobacteriota bacterium]